MYRRVKDGLRPVPPQPPSGNILRVDADDAPSTPQAFRDASSPPSASRASRRRRAVAAPRAAASEPPPVTSPRRGGGRGLCGLRGAPRRGSDSSAPVSPLAKPAGRGASAPRSARQPRPIWVPVDAASSVASERSQWTGAEDEQHSAPLPSAMEALSASQREAALSVQRGLGTAETDHTLGEDVGWPLRQKTVKREVKAQRATPALLGRCCLMLLTYRRALRAASG